MGLFDDLSRVFFLSQPQQKKPVSRQNNPQEDKPSERSQGVNSEPPRPYYRGERGINPPSKPASQPPSVQPPSARTPSAQPSSSPKPSARTPSARTPSSPKPSARTPSARTPSSPEPEMELEEAVRRFLKGKNKEMKDYEFGCLVGDTMKELEDIKNEYYALQIFNSLNESDYLGKKYGGYPGVGVKIPSKGIDLNKENVSDCVKEFDNRIKKNEKLYKFLKKKGHIEDPHDPKFPKYKNIRVGSGKGRN